MTTERELGWDDEIEKDGGGFILLPEGDYNFTVSKMERARFPGSSKMPACNQAKVELTIHSQEYGDVPLEHSLLLHTKTEGFLSNFFMGIGQKREGEKVRMNWQVVVGARGRCKIRVDNYTKKNGEPGTSNKIDTFYEPTAPQGGYQQPQQTHQAPQQQTYQQPVQQAPFPTQQPQQGGGYTAGQF